MLNRLLRRMGWMVVPTPPPSAKMLRECSNVLEMHRSIPVGKTVAWMRRVADLMEASR